MMHTPRRPEPHQNPTEPARTPAARACPGLRFGRLGLPDYTKTGAGPLARRRLYCRNMSHGRSALHYGVVALVRCGLSSTRPCLIGTASESEASPARERP